MRLTNRRLPAFSLAELLLGMGLFALLITSVATFSLDAMRAIRNSGVKVHAMQAIQETTNAVLMNKDSLWSLMVEHTGDGVKHMVYDAEAETYGFEDGSGPTSDGISLTLQINEVQRNQAGEIVTTAGVVDFHTRAIVIQVTWIDFLGMSNSLESTVYVSDWNTLRVMETTQAEFNTGTRDMTVITNEDDGEVTMETIIFADWCKPSLTQSSHDLPGQGVAQSIVAHPGSIFMGTGGNASGVSFAKMNFTASEPPVVSATGTFDGYKTNAVFGDGQYGYIGTDTNSREIVIINTATTPFSQIGYFDAPGNNSGRGVFATGNVGVMVTSSRLYTFDVTSKTGARPALGNVVLQNNISDLFVRGNFAYVTYTSGAVQAHIISISNPSAPAIVGTITTPNTSLTAVYVAEDETRAYLGANSSSSQREVFVIDVTTKTGNKTPFSSYETNGMSVTDLVVPEGSQRLLIGGKNGTEQYQVATLNNESNPQYCGGLAIVNGVNGVAAVTESNGNVYSHLVTNNPSAELRVLKGGPGGGGGNGQGVASQASYSSSVFDTESETTQYFTLDWQGTVPNNAMVRVQVRTSEMNTFSGINWVGPDGTSGSYFSSPGVMQLPQSLSNKRYLQYRVLFDSADNIASGVFDQIEITYQK